MKQFRPEYKDILKISAPISFSLLVPQVSFIVNTLFVASLGTTPLSVIGLASIYYLLLTWMGYGINNALLMFLSRASGAQDKSAFRQYFQAGILIALGFIVIMAISTFVGFESTYDHFIQDKDILAQCAKFIAYRMIGFPFLILNQMINIIFISMGNTLKLLYGSLVGNVVNILLDFILIFGYWGCEPWGVNGAAVGSAAGEIAYFIVMLMFFIRSNFLVNLHLFRDFKINLSHLKDILKASGPLIFQYIFSIGGWQYFFLLMEKKGHDYVAATHILRNALGLIGVGAWAFASTSNTMMGNFLGQNNSGYIKSGLKRIMIMAGGFGLTLSLILFIFKWDIIGLYTDDPHVQELVISGLNIIYFSSMLMCMSTVAFNAVIGIGKTRQSMIFEVSAVILYSAYLYLIVEVFNLNYFWAWTSDMVYWLILILASSAYMYQFVQKMAKQNFQ